MKIKDIVLDWMLDTVLFEMAYQRKHAIRMLENLHPQIAKHLIKHLHYGVSNETKKHWEAELNAWLGTLNDLVLKGNKRLSGDVYYEHLFTRPLGTLVDVEQRIRTIDKLDGMASHDKVGTSQELHEKLEKILHAISYDLSNDKLEPINHYIENFK